MKRIALLLALVLAAAVPAIAEPIEQISSVEGVVLELVEGESLLLNAGEEGEVRVSITDETQWDADRAPTVGDYVYVDFAGEALPAAPEQATALAVRCHPLAGDVLDFYADERAVLLRTEASGEVYVRLPEAWQGEVAAGDRMLIYFNGVMTMSLPGQVNAGLAMRLYAVEGKIAQIDANSLLLDAEGGAIQVNFGEDALPDGIAVGDSLRVFYDGIMSKSIPAQIFGREIVHLNA